MRDAQELLLPKKKRSKFKPAMMQTRSLDPQHMIGDMQASVAVFKAVVGPGILFLPSGVKSAGLASALFLTAVVGFISAWCMLLLLESARELRARGIKVSSLGDLGFAAFGQAGKVAVETAVVMAQLGFCTAYCVFIAENLQAAIYEAYDGFPAPPGSGEPCSLPPSLSGERLVYFIILFTILPLTPLTWIRHLKYFATSNIIASLLVMSTLLYMLIAFVCALAERGPASEIRVFNLGGSLVYFGTAMYAFEGIGVLLPVERSMTTPDRCPYVVCSTMTVVTLAQMVFASSAYLLFGGSTASIITTSLTRGGVIGGEKAAVAVQLAWCVVVLLTFPLQLFPAARVLESSLLPDTRSGKKWTKNGLRSLAVVFIVVAAISGFNHIESVVALIGAVSCVPLAMVYPAIFHFKVCVLAKANAIDEGCSSSDAEVLGNGDAGGSQQSKRCRTAAWSDLAIVGLGSFGVMVAVVLALQDMLHGVPPTKTCILKSSL